MVLRVGRPTLPTQSVPVMLKFKSSPLPAAICVAVRRSVAVYDTGPVRVTFARSPSTNTVGMALSPSVVRKRMVMVSPATASDGSTLEEVTCVDVGPRGEVRPGLRRVREIGCGE
jgi:hypothetical protein